MTDRPKPPLWRVMEMELPGPDYDSAHWAPVLRHLADWLVPEEAKPTGMRSPADSFRRHERKELRQLLLAEADRAEAGE